MRMTLPRKEPQQKQKQNSGRMQHIVLYGKELYELTDFVYFKDATALEMTKQMNEQFPRRVKKGM